MSGLRHETNHLIMADWFENSYKCPECGESWTDQWSCMCDDRCPKCDTECAPIKSIDLSRPLTLDDYLGAARLMTGSDDAQASAATDESAAAYAGAVMEGGERRFVEVLRESGLLRRFHVESA